MHALDVIDSALQWETERQNRLHQQALDLKKKQEADEGRDAPPSMASAAIDAVPGFPDRIGRIPGMRSALMPPDDSSESEAWSKPFALTKADIEPWTSFLAGYNQSRLFLQPASGAASAAAAQAQEPSRLDYAVRALLTLKRAPVRVVLEPPVQINRQVEYQDLEADLRASAGRLRQDTMLKLALELHQKQLSKAVDAGRKLGDDLYEAMMGDGYCNLIRTWERVYGRKPSIDELHLMLSSGRVKPLERRASDASDEMARAELQSPAQPASRPAPPTRMEQKPMPAALAASVEEDDQDDALVTIAAAPAMVKRKVAPPAKSEAKAQRSRRIYWYLLHAAATTASAAALTWFWLG